MEYLMTYGWAILIIAVVLGVLFQMGVFNSSSLTVRMPPGACKVLRTSAAVNLVGQCSGILPKYVAQFDGQSSYVNILNSQTVEFNGLSTITIGAWVNLNSYPSSLAIVAEHGAQYYLTISPSGQVESYFYGLNPAGYYATTNVIPLNTWTYVSTTYNGAGVNNYINGVNAYSAAVTGTISYGNGHLNTPLWLGAEIGSSRWLSGEESNVQIYNTSLDASSIATLYQEGIGGAPVNPQYLVGWWPLNGDTKDYSSNNNNGAPTSLTYTAQYGK